MSGRICDSPFQKNNADPLFLCFTNKARKPFGKASLLYYLHYVSYLFNWTMQEMIKTCQTFISTSNPPLQNNHGSFVILSSKKRNQENTIWRKGSSHYLPTCTMSPVFSTRPNKTSPRLAKDSPFNFHPPPSKTTTGPLSSCLLKRNQKNTIWRKGRVVLTI